VSKTAVVEFSGDNRFLSNFYTCKVRSDGVTYPSLEHAFQAAKTDSGLEKEAVAAAPTPGKAKRLGRKVTLRPNWSQDRLRVMTSLLHDKFTRHHYLRQALLATEDALLIEGNSWGDTYWGQSPLGTGKNHLGNLLMNLRSELGEVAK